MTRLALPNRTCVLGPPAVGTGRVRLPSTSSPMLLVRKKPSRPPPPNCLSRPKMGDRKSTRLNSSHLVISYAVFCLKKKKNIVTHDSAADHKLTPDHACEAVPENSKHTSKVARFSNFSYMILEIPATMMEDLSHHRC